MEIFYVQESNNLIQRENTGAKLKNQTAKVLEITESICFFYGFNHIDVFMSKYQIIFNFIFETQVTPCFQSLWACLTIPA